MPIWDQHEVRKTEKWLILTNHMISFVDAWQSWMRKKRCLSGPPKIERGTQEGKEMKYHGKGMLLQYRRIKTKSEQVIPSSCFKDYVYVYTLKMGGWTVNFTLDTLSKKYSHFLELPLAINI